jgi:1-acyl-sn-glycerol-3-phosphate acyltransferase
MLIWTFVRFLAGWAYTLIMSTLACVFMLLLGPSRGWLLICRPWACGSLWIVGVKLEIVGAEHLKGPAVFVSNHQSLIDVVFLPAILPRTVRWVAKRELQWVPLWGWAFARGGAVLIDRNNPRSAIFNIREGLKRLPKGWSVVVFPEGTRSYDGKLKRFKKGAFHIAVETGMPVVPIGMDGADDIIRVGDWLVRPGVVRVTLGKPISTVGWTNDDLDGHIAEVRGAVQECINASIARRVPRKDPAYRFPRLLMPPWRRHADPAHNRGVSTP